MSAAVTVRVIVLIEDLLCADSTAVTERNSIPAYSEGSEGL